MSTVLLVAYLAHRWSLSVSTPLSWDAPRLLPRDNNLSASTGPQFDQRSVGELVWGCLATVFACSWVAVHPNIPPQDSTSLQRALIRFELMLWTILAPEIIVLWSAKQWIAARRVREAYRDRGWTVTHGFFIQMGGFALYDGRICKGVLTPQHFDELLKSGEIEFPDVTAEEIEDRSKGDGLSKGLVLLQTLWFIAQLAARVIEGLAVTQLELATSGFAALNGFMYFFWWNKPLDIRYPIPIHLLNPTIKTTKDINDIPNHPGARNSFPDVAEEVVRQHCILQDTNGCLLRHGQPIFLAFDENDSNSISLTPLSGSQTQKTLPIHKEQIYQPNNVIFVDQSSKPTPIDDHEHSSTSRVSNFQTHLEVAWESRFILVEEDPDFLLLDTPHVPMFFSAEVPRRGILLGSVISTSLGVLFGAIHVAGWNLAFPTQVESHMWRISSLIVLGYPMAFFMVLVPQLIAPPEINVRARGKWREVGDTVIFFPLYVGARLFILLEVFLALRKLSESAINDVSWTAFLPHI
ncbi:hypothetical protein BDN70DRAFT_838058 [Pholiota conissans]|uniref:Uncharacterized protein n=1 Tax=Pholiota conissans TaxID=109636 RepID=A0A9P6CSH4_9AGAR|nr:hypothetical protein BDN70DRAFT_838058 [Pholiota conissans]